MTLIQVSWSEIFSISVFLTAFLSFSLYIYKEIGRFFSIVLYKARMSIFMVLVDIIIEFIVVEYSNMKKYREYQRGMTKICIYKLYDYISEHLHTE